MDSKDKKLIQALLTNARSPISVLAKTPGLTREIVRHRLDKLVSEGIIKAFITRLHQPYFIQGVANLMIKLRKADEQKIQVILKHLNTHSQINWVTELCGTYDIMCTITYFSLETLSSTVSSILELCGSNIQDHQLSLYLEEFKFDRIGLITEREKIIEDTGTQLTKTDKIQLDDADKEILANLSVDCRIKNSELANITGQSEDVIRLRIRKYLKTGIIKGFTLVLDPEKLGYEGYQIGLQFEQFSNETIQQIKAYVTKNPYVTFCARTSGKFNLMIAMEVKNRMHFKEELQKLRISFSDSIRTYEFHMSLNEHKEVFLTKDLILMSNTRLSSSELLN